MGSSANHWDAKIQSTKSRVQILWVCPTKGTNPKVTFSRGAKRRGALRKGLLTQVGKTRLQEHGCKVQTARVQNIRMQIVKTQTTKVQISCTRQSSTHTLTGPSIHYEFLVLN